MANVVFYQRLNAIKIPNNEMMRETDFYFNLVLFIFASQLYFYVLGPSSLLGY